MGTLHQITEYRRFDAAGLTLSMSRDLAAAPDGRLAPVVLDRLDGVAAMLARSYPHVGPFRLMSPVTALLAETARRARSAPTGERQRLVRTLAHLGVLANPCRIAGAGREKSPERMVVGVEDVYRLAGLIRPKRWRALVLLAAFGGLRWGELAGLRRHRLDLDAGTVRVDMSVIDIEGHLSDGPPKWDSRRTVTLPAPVVAELRAHVASYSEKGRTGRVFVGAHGGTLRRSNFQAAWRKATKAADVPLLHFHDLRHVGNTLASNTGANLRELMARMGHASPQAALIYQHATAARDRSIADALGAMIEDALGADGGQEDDEA